MRNYYYHKVMQEIIELNRDQLVEIAREREIPYKNLKKEALIEQIRAKPLRAHPAEIPYTTAQQMFPSKCIMARPMPKQEIRAQTPKAYQYLIDADSNNPRAKEQVLLAEVTGPKFIVRGEIPQFHFMNFENSGHFHQWLMAQPEQNRAYHEIIKRYDECRIFLDIDAICPAKMHDDIIAQIKSGLFNQFVENWAIEPYPRVFRTRYDELPEKLSCHIVVPGFKLPDIQSVKEFIKQVIARINKPEITKYIDIQVYRPFGSLRLPLNHKVGQKATKHAALVECPNPQALPYSDQVIACKWALQYDMPLKIRAQKAQQKIRATLTNDQVAEALALVEKEGLNAQYKFRRQEGNILNFDRIAPGQCNICDRVHDKDNTFYIIMHKDNITFRCRHNDKYIKVGRAKAIEDSDPWCQPDKVDRTVIDRPEIGEITPKSGTFCIRSPMGSGKTKSLINFLNKCGPDETIIILSFRLTFSADLARKLPDFQLYNKISGRINIDKTPRLIIQVESLHRLNYALQSINRAKLTLILDESESIISQWSNYNSNTERNFDVFSWLVAQAKQVICIDANLSARTFRTITSIRPSKPEILDNIYKSGQKTVQIIAEETEWLGQLTSTLKSGLKVAVPCNTLKRANAIGAHFKETMPTLNIGLYASDTAESEKARVFSNVHENMKHDLLIYTPTLSAGISFELEHYDIMFARFSNKGADCYTCFQMLGRIRAIKQNRIVMYYKKSSFCNYVTNEGALLRIVARSDDLVSEVTKFKKINYVRAPSGEITLDKNPWAELSIQNQLVLNKSRNNFLDEICGLFARAGYNVTRPKNVFKDKAPSSELNNQEEKIFKAKNKNLLEAQQISAPEYSGLLAAQKSGQTITADQKLSIERYIIENTYPEYVYNARLIEYGADCNKIVYCARREVIAPDIFGPRLYWPDRAKLDMFHSFMMITRGALKSVGYSGFEGPEKIEKGAFSKSLEEWHKKLNSNDKLIIQEILGKSAERKTHQSRLILLNKMLSLCFDISVEIEARSRYILVPSAMFGPNNELLLAEKEKR